MVDVEHTPGQRFRADAGIAIGPILFIIAILAILAAAIAAGSGDFTAGTTTESNRTKAAAMIQIGDVLKTGMDRLFMENQTPFATVDTNVANTTTNYQLFSPIGGGITPPSYAMANSPSPDGTATSGDIWFFPQGAVPGLGNTTPELLAVLKVAQGVCNEINNKIISNAIVPPVNDLGNFASTSNLSGMMAAWPAIYNGTLAGCVQNNNAGSSGYYFFEVLAVQ